MNGLTNNLRGVARRIDTVRGATAHDITELADIANAVRLLADSYALHQATTTRQAHLADSGRLADRRPEELRQEEEQAAALDSRPAAVEHAHPSTTDIRALAYSVIDQHPWASSALRDAARLGVDYALVARAELTEPAPRTLWELMERRLTLVEDHRRG